MHGIAFVAERGGCGKSSLAHALALGAAWKGKPAYFLHTDARDPLRINGRPYAYFDARDPKKLEALSEAALNNDGLFIVDGGGNRPEFDKWITGAMDLVIMPIRADQEDVRTNLKHLERLQKQGNRNIRIILNDLSGNVHLREKALKLWKPVPKELVMGYMPHVEAVRVLREDDDGVGFETPPTKVNKFARHLYDIVMKEIEGAAKKPELAIAV